MLYTKEDIDNFIYVYNSMEEKLLFLLKEMLNCNIEKYESTTWLIDEDDFYTQIYNKSVLDFSDVYYGFSQSNKVIMFDLSEYRYGERDTTTFYIPIEWLTMTEFERQVELSKHTTAVEIHKQEQKKIKLERDKDEELFKLSKQKEQEKEEYELYLSLKEKYETI